MTASQIADELGGVSRNAVIGKAHRLGLQSRPSPVKAGEGRKNAASKRPVAKKPVAEAEKPSAVPAAMPKPRSEEHKSELQSLLRISYAVFCLKKNKPKIPTPTSITKTDHHSTTHT